MTEWMKDGASLLALLISLGTVVTVTIPALRRKLGEFFLKDDTTKEEILRIRNMLDAHVAQDREKKSEMGLQREVDRCVLRDLITNIYYKYAKEKKIPVYALEDANALFELYAKRGGNSYVKSLIRQMTEEWEVIR